MRLKEVRLASVGDDNIDNHQLDGLDSRIEELERQFQSSSEDEPAALVQCNCGSVELKILGPLRYRMECCCCDCNGIGYWAEEHGGPKVGHHAVDLFIFHNAVEINRGHEHIAFYK